MLEKIKDNLWKGGLNFSKMLPAAGTMFGGLMMMNMVKGMDDIFNTKKRKR